MSIKKLTQIINHEALVPTIVDLESDADKIMAEAKKKANPLYEQAQSKRDQLKEYMLSKGLKTVSTQDGVRVTVSKPSVQVKITDNDALGTSIRQFNMDKIFIKTVPEHQEINTTQLIEWLKSGGQNAWTMFKGLEVTEKQGNLSITVPK